MNNHHILAPSPLKKILLKLPILSMVGLFIIIPFLLIFRISLSDMVLSVPPFRELFEWIEPYNLKIHLNLENYVTIFTDAHYIKALYTSIQVAAITSLFCLFLGFGMAYGIYSAEENYQPYLLLLIALPFWTSFLIRIYAWMGLLGKTGLINSVLLKLHLIVTPLTLMDNMLGTCISMVYCYLPFMIFPIYSALNKLDPSYIEASYDLGASPLRTFLSVTVPLCKNGIITGIIFVFIPTIGEFIIPELMGGPELVTVGRVLWNEFFYNRNWPLASALAVTVVILFVIPVFWWQRREFQKPTPSEAEEENA